MTRPEDMFELEGNILEGRFHIDQVVAAGGFGVVYRALHTALDKRVAIKVLRTPEHPDPEVRSLFLESFSREARTIARLEHPAIVKVIDFGVSTMPSGVSTPWMALEWLEGRTLAEDLREGRGKGGLSPQTCLERLAPICEALACAHAQGIAHRDVKPDNILLLGEARWPGSVPTRLLDFGIAKVMHPEEDDDASGHTATQAAKVAFSLPYASPEQISHTRTGPWTDVHALGLVLTEMLIGRAPLRGRDAVDYHQQILASVRPSPARFEFDVGPWEAVIVKALALRPADRYPHAGALLDALRAEVPSEVGWKASAVTAPAVKPARTTGPDETLPMRPVRWVPALVVAIGVVAAALLARPSSPRVMALPQQPATIVAPPPAAAPVPSPPTAPPAPIASPPVPTTAVHPRAAAPARPARTVTVRPAPRVVAPIETPTMPAPATATVASPRGRRVITE